ncbi:MAG: hypothetical protein ISR52_03270 [Rhodospirillales bacterium]|nr:hypothetical protein [Rhodospirillales bacterium]
MSDGPEETVPPDPGPPAARGHGPFAILLFWGVASFVFFNVCFELNYSSGITLFAAFLLAAMAAVTIFAATRFYEINMGRELVRLQPGQKFSFLRISILFYLSSAAINAVLGKLMISGFAVKLNEELSGQNLLYDPAVPFGEMFLYLVIILFPVTLHYVLIAIGLSAQADRLNDPEGE